MRIGFDLTGGDLGYEATVPAARQLLEEGVDVVPIGPIDVLRQLDPGYDIVTPELTERFQNALRPQKDHPMRLAMSAIDRGEIDCLVTAGNTQQLVAGAVAQYAGLHRRNGLGSISPALSQGLPYFLWSESEGRVVMPHTTTVLDIGASVDASAEQLARFAVMGVAYRRALEGSSIDDALPKLAMISNGTEDYKGDERTREALKLLREFDGSLFSLEGMCEGSSLVSSNLDVIAGDGRVLNIAIKMAEALVSQLLVTMRGANNHEQADKSNNVRQAQLEIMNGLLGTATSAALLLGVPAYLFKAHGSSDTSKLVEAVRFASTIRATGVQDQIEQYLRQIPTVTVN